MSSSIYTYRVRPVVASLLLALSGAAVAQDAPGANAIAQADQAAQKVAATICASCHGATGTSTSPLFPRLAGQQEAYLNAQLKAFKGKTRGEQDAHDYMWGMATLLDDAVIDGLSRYYAAQKPAPGMPGDPALLARGKVLYEQGEPARQVAACSACHGENAAGVSIFPRLAGQHAAYVVRQLDAIQHKFRDSPVMHGVIKELDPADMKAVAAYVQSR
ncbi:c-type cytochrome [Roseateles koreensis]|uniref:C-type cytochrome n=1 Tax=Roseateles koreensis TaxID=2987526 RepID=A0ABT5KLN4_9BURK|nr:c-type cytochrome [Roseateles koreensis]MDC8783824.1 c-type cytochrome [Roseateles koreensis]